MTTIREALTEIADRNAEQQSALVTTDSTYTDIRDAVVGGIVEWVETGVNVALEQARSLGYLTEATDILRESGLIDPEPEPEPAVTEEAPSTLDAILDAVNEVKAKVETDLSELVRRVGALERAAADNGIRLG